MKACLSNKNSTKTAIQIKYTCQRKIKFQILFANTNQLIRSLMLMYLSSGLILKFWSIRIAYILAMSRGTAKLGLGCLCARLLGFKEPGKMIRSFKDIKLHVRAIIRVGLRQGLEMVRASLYGEMGKNIKANGTMGINMVLEFGNLAKEIAILGNGIMVKFKVMGYILAQMGKDIKGFSKIFLKMVEENKHFLMETFMKGIIDKENLVEKGSIYGKMKQ